MNEEKIFYLKLRKLLDLYRPDWQNDEALHGDIEFDDNWLQIRTPYFFDESLEKWDGLSFTRDFKDVELWKTWLTRR